MYRTRFLAVFLIAVAVSLVSCSKSDTNQSAAIPANTEVVANSNSVDANKPSGGQVTVISGADKGVIKIRSTGFRWPTCLKRVVDALRDTSGATNVTPDITAQPLTVTVRFDEQKTSVQRIGEIAREVTASDPKITGPVTVIYEEEK